MSFNLFSCLIFILGCGLSHGFFPFSIFGNVFGSGKVCPMPQNLPEGQTFDAFERGCPPSSGSSCDACRFSLFRNQHCCPTLVDGQCQWSCLATISRSSRPGACPAGMMSRPSRFNPSSHAFRWAPSFCEWVSANKQLSSSYECRYDEDCTPGQKCCRPLPTADNVFETCSRKCVPAVEEIPAVSVEESPAGATTASDEASGTLSKPQKPAA